MWLRQAQPPFRQAQPPFLLPLAEALEASLHFNSRWLRLSKPAIVFDFRWLRLSKPAIVFDSRWLSLSKLANCQFYTVSSPKCLFLGHPLFEFYVKKNTIIIIYSGIASK
jgi:hypothetical protein